MSSGISFGSMFNPEKVSRRHVEGALINPENNLERLNAHQAGRALSDEEFIEQNLEGLRNREEPSRQFPVSPQDALGRSQIKTPNSINLSDEDAALLKTLSFEKYGFFNDNGNFWVQSKKQKENGSFGFTLGDGILTQEMTKQDFVKNLVNNNVQAFNISGINKDGDKLNKTFILDKDTNNVTIYSSEYPDGEACLELFGFDDFKSAIDDTIDNLDTIYGATVWK